MDIEKLIEQLNDWNEKYISNLCGDRTIKCEEYCIKDDCLIVKAATALSTLQAENEKLRADLARVTVERDGAVKAVKNMAEYIVCAGRVDYFLCDEISQEHHLKYQPKNDGNYDNEPCYKCIADWFLQGHEWQENC